MEPSGGHVGATPPRPQSNGAASRMPPALPCPCPAPALPCPALDAHRTLTELLKGEGTSHRVNAKPEAALFPFDWGMRDDYGRPILYLMREAKHVFVYGEGVI